MNISTHSQNSVDSLLEAEILLFSSFKSVYLFGSILYHEVINNDIDILLIYEDFSEKLLDDLTQISNCLEKELGIHIDLTVLSEIEEKETDFLGRLNGRYLKIK